MSDAPQRRRVLIVGGVAGGASCAARLRRLDEEAEIVLFDRGPYVSFANCGLPYFVGNVIADERKLLVASRELFRERFDDRGADAARGPCHRPRRTAPCASAISTRPAAPSSARSAYDVLVLSPGAAPIRPPIAGIDLPGVFAVRTIPDSGASGAGSTSGQPTRALVVGGGFIGLEMAENLAHRGLTVTVLEKLPQVMPPLDAEMAAAVAEHLRARRASSCASATGSRASSEAETARSSRSPSPDARLAADLVILAIGVRPETALAQAAGLAARPARRHRRRRADAHGRSAHLRRRRRHRGARRRHRPGDDPAARRAGEPPGSHRRRGDRRPRPRAFRGVQATAIVGVFGLTVACTGASEKGLRRAGVTEYEKSSTCTRATTPATTRARSRSTSSCSSRVPDGRVLGAQAVGLEGVDKRIDVIATVIQMGGTVARSRGGRALLRAAVRRRQGSR